MQFYIKYWKALIASVLKSTYGCSKDDKHAVSRSVLEFPFLNQVLLKQLNSLLRSWTAVGLKHLCKFTYSSGTRRVDGVSFVVIHVQSEIVQKLPVHILTNTDSATIPMRK